VKRKRLMTRLKRGSAIITRPLKLGFLIVKLKKFYWRVEKRLFVHLMKKRLYYLTLDSTMLKLNRDVVNVIIDATLDSLISKLPLRELITSAKQPPTLWHLGKKGYIYN